MLVCIYKWTSSCLYTTAMLNGPMLQAFWVSHDGSAVAWLPVKTHGHAPSARFHHTTTAFDGEAV